MSTPRDPDRLIRAFLLEGEDELFDPVYDRVRAGIERKPQRVVIGPWRTPVMNKIVGFGLAAAAVVVVVIVGAQLLAPPGDRVGGPAEEPTPTPEASAASPSPEPSVTGAPDGSLAEGPFLVFDPATQSPPFDDAPPITVTISAPGWTALPEFGALVKGDGLDPPETTGAALLTGDTGSDAFYVYGDPCQWESTTPDVPATTVDEIVEALTAQASRNATAPVDVTVGGYAGKHITLYVPNTAPTRAQAFQDCDQNTFASWGVEGFEGPSRYSQGPGQVDELWILDVDGTIAILDVTYGPATPSELVDEARAIAESASFEAP